MQAVWGCARGAENEKLLGVLGFSQGVLGLKKEGEACNRGGMTEHMKRGQCNLGCKKKLE